jgi:iron complex transport system substrate-binding protein
MGLTQMEQLNALSPEFFYDQANRLYPHIFNYDVKTMIKNSVKEYFGTELTDEQVNYMLNGLNPTGGSLY